MTVAFKVLLALLFVVLIPAAALACPVCGVAGTRDNWQAYLSMSAMLSIVPFGFAGGIALWIHFRSKE